MTKDIALKTTDTTEQQFIMTESQKSSFLYEQTRAQTRSAHSQAVRAIRSQLDKNNNCCLTVGNKRFKQRRGMVIQIWIRYGDGARPHGDRDWGSPNALTAQVMLTNCFLHEGSIPTTTC